MLAAVVNAPSRLAPPATWRRRGARARLVLRAMAEVGYISEGKGRGPPRPRPPGAARRRPHRHLFRRLGPPPCRRAQRRGYGQRLVQTTLEGDLQRLAVRAVRRAGLGRAQAALVAMCGSTAGGGDGRRQGLCGEPVHRAVQARRQPARRSSCSSISPPSARASRRDAGQRHPDPPRQLAAAQL